MDLEINLELSRRYIREEVYEERMIKVIIPTTGAELWAADLEDAFHRWEKQIVEIGGILKAI